MGQSQSGPVQSEKQLEQDSILTQEYKRRRIDNVSRGRQMERRKYETGSIREFSERSRIAKEKEREFGWVKDAFHSEPDRREPYNCNRF